TMHRRRTRRAMVKREPNSGSVYQRTDGRWVASVQVGHGSRNAPAKRRYLYGRSKREVQRKLNIDGLVFTSVRSTPLDGRNVTRVFKDQLNAAKLPPVRLHDLRHTTVSLL